mmetsp:Transcript_4090/g.7590  ORF Transcript_4090/g.7590 Transcript_4090/m.7590 type:complete len:234 (-) Transcript_4090:295-996(-)
MACFSHRCQLSIIVKGTTYTVGSCGAQSIPTTLTPNNGPGQPTTCSTICVELAGPATCPTSDGMYSHGRYPGILNIVNGPPLSPWDRRHAVIHHDCPQRMVLSTATAKETWFAKCHAFPIRAPAPSKHTAQNPVLYHCRAEPQIKHPNTHPIGAEGIFCTFVAPTLACPGTGQGVRRVKLHTIGSGYMCDHASGRKGPSIRMGANCLGSTRILPERSQNNCSWGNYWAGAVDR